MKVLPIEQVRAMTPEEFTTLAKSGFSLEKASNKATDAHKTSFPAMGIIVCVAEEKLNYLKSEVDEKGQPKKRQISQNTSLAEYWKTSVVCNKDAKLNPHYLSCAVTYGTYVRCDLITEAAYAKNTAECLELAASISTACGHDVTHEAVLEAAAELTDRSKDSRKILRTILDRVKGAKPLTDEKVREMLAAIMAAGFLNIVIGAVGGEVAHISDEENAKHAYFGLLTATAMFTSNVDETGNRRFPDDRMEAWEDPSEAEHQAETKIKILAAGKPVEQKA